MKLDYNRLGNLGVVAWVLLAVPVIFLAEQSEKSYRPAPRTALAAGGAAEGEGRGKRARQAAEETWPKVEAFMRTTSPKKWAAYNKLPLASQAALRTHLIARYNELGDLAGNEKLHKIEVDRVAIEDELFGELSKRKQSHAQGDPYSPEYLSAVRKLIENRMKEHQARLEKLKALVEKDEALKNDPSKLDMDVLERARAIEKNGFGAGQGGRRRISGEPATSESDDEVLPANPDK